LFHLDFKPVFYTVGDETRRHKEENDGWDQRKADKGHHQFGPQLRTQNLPLSLEDEFDQIPDNQEDKEENKDDVNIDEAEDNDVVADGDHPTELWDLHLNRGKNDDQNRDDPDNEEFIPSLS